MPGKLQLDAESLRVDSFDAVSNPAREDGTVHGYAGYTSYGNQTCRPYYTCPECAPIDTR